MSSPRTDVTVGHEGITVVLYDSDGLELATKQIPWADCIDSEKGWSVFSEIVQPEIAAQQCTVRGDTKPFETIDDTKYGSLVDNG
jgi:hypothetical protein